MNERLKHDQWLRLFPFGTLDKIRRLNLNNKPTKSKLLLHQQFHQYKANADNLIRIRNAGYKTDSRIIFTTCNIQSLHYKELQVGQLVLDYSLDTTILNRDQLKLRTVDHTTGKGGGLVLIHQAQYPVKTINIGTKPSFEFAVWELRVKYTTITVHGIYHPPYLRANKITNTKFIEDFTHYISTNLSNHQNKVFIGDFNLHVSNELDIDATIFGDSIDALGLYQHVGFPTHNSGNVLDLIISDITNDAKVLTTSPGPFITDHRAVIATLILRGCNHPPKKYMSGK